MVLLWGHVVYSVGPAPTHQPDTSTSFGGVPVRLYRRLEDGGPRRGLIQLDKGGSRLLEARYGGGRGRHARQASRSGAAAFFFDFCAGIMDFGMSKKSGR